MIHFAQLSTGSQGASAPEAAEQTAPDASGNAPLGQSAPVDATRGATAFPSDLPEGWPSPRSRPDQRELEEPPPVRITVTEDGRVMLQSDDPAALNVLEELIHDMAPPQKEFEVFEIKHVDAYWVAYDLRDYFKDDIADDTDNLPYWYRYEMGAEEEELGRLSRRRKLTFIYNTDANAVIVRGATPEQLRIIKELIAIFDHPSDEESTSVRRTEIYQVRFSSARVIADAIKEAYRDLLSSKDTAFQTPNGEQQQGGRQSSRTELVRIYDYGSSDTEKKPTPMKVSFEGALSLGVDELSNTIIISAQEELIDGIIKIATHLDEQAKPNTSVAVHQVRSVDAASLHAMLARTLADPWTGGKRPQVQGQPQPQPNGEQPEQANQAEGQRQQGRNGNGNNGNGQGNATMAVAQ
jgi:hypothetical protein